MRILKQNIHLSKNLSLTEFNKGNAKYIYVDPLLVAGFQWIRDQVGHPLTINSGYRTWWYNRKVKGSRNSQHLYGKAIDIFALDVDGGPKALAAICEKYFSEQCRIVEGGIGIYKTFVHFDVRIKKARW